jgi:hypothetical protein
MQLRIVALNDGLEEIGAEAFHATSLKQIMIPKAVKVIKKGAFRNCYGLTTVTLGEGLEDIGASAFKRCTSLQIIAIPNDVGKIKEYACYECSGLTTVNLGGVSGGD